MRTIHIKSIPHSEQRYETVGDYWVDEHNGVQEVRVSDVGNPDYEFLVAMHELVELYICRHRCISEESISAFDEEFEKNRQPGNTDEPGNSPKAPYRREHAFATRVEKMIARQLGVDWEEYDRVINSLICPKA